MKKLFLFLLFSLAMGTFVFAQNVRYDAPFPSISSTTVTPFLVANVPPNSPTLAVCSSPANGVPCTNYATTYNSAGVACSNGAQDTPQPQPSACQSTGDAQGNIGFWAPAGTYDYTVCVRNNCFGPYTITLNTGGGGGGGNINPGTAVNQSITWNTGSSLWVPTAKPSYDISDPAWGFNCNGLAYNTSAAQALVSSIAGAQANVQITQANCGIGDFVFPANINLDFAPGGTLNLLTDNTTTPGTATYDSTAGATGQCQSNNTTPTCAMPVTAVANDSYALVCMRGFSSGAPASVTSSNSSDIFLAIPGTSTGQTSINVAYLVPNVTSGARTFTITFTNNLVGACSAIPISGLGPTPWLDGNGNNAAGNTTPMSSGAATFLSGSFLLSFGGNNNTAETCTAGAGFTQVPGAAGNSTNTNSVLCVQYKNSSSAGSTTATHTFTPSPSGNNWAYQIIGLRPSSAHVQVLGGISNPSNRQIFINATSTAGVVDFTGNLTPIDIYPEWWGASSTASATINTAALQASEIAAFGNNRSNGSGLNKYNKNWVLTQPYSINGELKLYHVIGVPGARAQMICKGGGAITQTATNQRILDMQSAAYFDIHGCNFSTSATQDATHPLVDDDYDGVSTAGDLKPQFTTFYDTTFNGNNIAAIGLLGAKSGGAAQYSNIYSLDNAMLGFTQACYQIGTPAHLATNALAIGFSGDMQSCPGNGMAIYGGGYVSISGSSNGMSSMENGFSTQTGFDIFGSQMQGPCVVEHFRSESRKFASCPTLYAKDVILANQASTPTPGSSDPIGTYKTGNYISGDGAWYKVSGIGGTYSGIGTIVAPLQASSGSGTTLVDTNQTVAGAVTIGTFGLTPVGETMTQAVTGSTGTRLNSPTSNGTITGTASGAQIVLGETMTQAVTGITCVEQAPTPATGSSTSLTCNNFSGTADNSHAWTGGTSGGVYTPSAAPVFAASNPSLLISAATGSPDNSHAWTGGTSGAVYVPTAVPANQAAFTVNAFNGMFVGIVSGTGSLCYGTVTSNTATSITLSAGWTTKYQYVSCPAPDSTSTFVVEPGWNHGTVVSGGMTMAYSNENTIQGESTGGIQGMQGTLEDINVPGGQVFLSGGPGAGALIRNLIVSRADWYNSSGGNSPQQDLASRDWDVRAILRSSPNAKPINWSFPSITGVTYSGALHRDLGAKVLCWSAGTIGQSSNTSANDVCIGGRSDKGAGATASRNIVEISAGMLGRGAPQPNAANSFNITDQAGTDFDITGGPSTGTGAGGAINFYTSVPAGSSSTPNSGTKRWVINGAGDLIGQGSQNIKVPGLAPATLVDGATITYNLGSFTGANATVTLGGNRTLNITNPVSGGTYVLRIVQDGTGSRTLTLGTGCTWKVFNGGAGAITLSTAAGAMDVLTFYYDGTNCYANLGSNYN